MTASQFTVYRCVAHGTLAEGTRVCPYWTLAEGPCEATVHPVPVVPASDLAVAVGALERIAAPKRPDGTYNRSREACERVARDALARLSTGEDG